MRSFIALAIALTATAALASEPIPLGPLNLVPAAYAQEPLDLAANGNDMLAVWSDARSTLDLSPSSPPALTRALFDVHLNAVGTPDDPVGRRLRPLAYAAKAAPRGDGYLLAYSDPSGTFTVALDASGAEIAAPKKLSGTSNANDLPLALAANGANFLLLQATGVTMLANDGSVLRTTPLPQFVEASRVWTLTNGAYQFVVFRFACNGVTPCIASAVLTTVTSGGDVSETQLYELPQRSHIAAAYGNGTFLVASQSDDVGGSTVEFRAFDASGHPLGSAVRVASRPAACICGYEMPAVGWDGVQFLVVYQWTDLRAVRVSPTGVLLDALPVVLDPTGGLPPIFARSAGGTTTLVWGSGSYATRDLASRTVRSFDELAGTASHIIAKSFDVERGLQLAGGPLGPLAVWMEGAPNASILYSIAGHAAATLAPAGAADLQGPAAARGRDAFLVAWREQNYDASGRPTTFRILARRISFDGAALGTAPIVVASETASTFSLQLPPLAVASDGTDWLVVYAGANATVRAARVSAGGAPLDPSPLVLTAPPGPFDIPATPRVVWSGSRYVALWAENRTNPLILAPVPPVVYVAEARITAAAQLIDTRVLWSGPAVLDVALAAAPARILGLWTDGTSLYSMLFGDDGVSVTGPSVLATAKAATTLPLRDADAAWDGSTFLVAWTLSPSSTDASIVYEHVGADGLPIESAPIELEPELGTKYTPSLTPSPFGVTVGFHTLTDTWVARAFATSIPRAGVPLRHRASR